MAACPTSAELSRCHRNLMIHKAENMCFLVLYSESFPSCPWSPLFQEPPKGTLPDTLVSGSCLPSTAGHHIPMPGSLPSLSFMLGIKCGAHCLATWVLWSAHLPLSPSPRPILLLVHHAQQCFLPLGSANAPFHASEFGKFNFLSLGGPFSLSICPSPEPYFFFRTLLGLPSPRKPLLPPGWG